MTKDQCRHIIQTAAPSLPADEFDRGWSEYAACNGATIYSPLDFIAAASLEHSEAIRAIGRD